MTTAPPRPGLSGEQLEIAATVRDLLKSRSTEAEVRAAAASELGYDPTVWSELSEMGVPALTVPEEWGGVGLGWVELGLVQEAAGAALLCSPLFSSTVQTVTLLLEAADDEAKADLLPPLASGQRRGAVAWAASHPGLARPLTDGIVVDRTGAGTTVTGRCTHVIDGATADDLLVVARDGGDWTVVAVRSDAPGISVRPALTLDLTRRQADIVFDGTPTRVVTRGEQVAAAVERAADLVLVMLAAEQVGLAQQCLETAVEYAGTRRQFDREIGSFQAIKHLCASMLIQVEGARATMLDAVRVAGRRDRSGLSHAACLAKIACSDHAFAVASDALHVHGGIGFTWEHSSHLYFRRAKASQLMFGTPRRHRERLLDLAGLATGSATGETIR